MNFFVNAFSLFCRFVEIKKASRQVVAGFRYRITAEFKTSENPSVLCEFDIWERSWIENGRVVKTNCNNEKKYEFKQQPKERVKRDILVGAPEESDPNDEHVSGLLNDHLSRLATGTDGQLE